MSYIEIDMVVTHRSAALALNRLPQLLHNTKLGSMTGAGGGFGAEDAPGGGPCPDFA